MKTLSYSLIALFGLAWSSTQAQDFKITEVQVAKDDQLKQLVFSIEVEGTAGASVPIALGQLDGAPVFGYVFPTSLKATDVGFDNTEGIVALALTSHPDFDDTPIWDENNDANYLNDGVVWHPHWVVLEENKEVAGGLAVKATTDKSTLPPTNPGMPMYMDSPGFPVTTKGNKIECVVPYYRINHQHNFSYDGVAARMQVNTSKPNIPMLGVYEVYSVASGDLSLPYSIGKHSCDTLTINISSSTGMGWVAPKQVSVYPNPSVDEVTIATDAELTGSLQIEIFDLTGKLVYQNDINTFVINVPTIEIGKSGTYALKIIDAKSKEVKGEKHLIITQR